ncbi:hypothetical protein [Bacillus sp. KH172YL63]|uniref:hypothetical protein n=1 Tax=Bacillus sp. KH172YL63 TaxID=2709784 RepID=UPI0013E4A9B7|nr:hypothetical protein [Bacillus sp. KH172YL63]BCB03997.1 hypothetical protein KH172YL63_21300 [Bacillus sp. KH172YL63]
MTKEVLTGLIILIILTGLVLTYLMNRYKRRVVEVISLESFLQPALVDEDAAKKKGIVDSINDYFDTGDGSDDGDSDGDGDDSGD